MGKHDKGQEHIIRAVRQAAAAPPPRHAKPEEEPQPARELHAGLLEDLGLAPGGGEEER